MTSASDSFSRYFNQKVVSKSMEKDFLSMLHPKLSIELTHRRRQAPAFEAEESRAAQGEP